MKVLIKVEIDENRQWAEANKLYDLLKNYKSVLMPMPSKRKSMVEWVDANVKTHDLTEYDKGWNDCVEFLEGELND